MYCVPVTKKFPCRRRLPANHSEKFHGDAMGRTQSNALIPNTKLEG